MPGGPLVQRLLRAWISQVAKDSPDMGGYGTHEERRHAISYSRPPLAIAALDDKLLGYDANAFTSGMVSLRIS